MKRNENSLRDLWDNFKGTNIQSKGCQNEKRQRKYLKR